MSINPTINCRKAAGLMLALVTGFVEFAVIVGWRVKRRCVVVICIDGGRYQFDTTCHDSIIARGRRKRAWRPTKKLNFSCETRRTAAFRVAIVYRSTKSKNITATVKRISKLHHHLTLISYHQLHGSHTIDYSLAIRSIHLVASCDRTHMSTNWRDCNTIWSSTIV